MSSEARDRIATAVARLGYTPNRFARGLRSKRSGMIGLLVVNLSYPFASLLSRGLGQVAYPAGYQVITADFDGSVEKERQYLHMFSRGQVDGLVIQTEGKNRALLEKIAGELPVVLVDRNYGIPHTDSIVINDLEASEEMTRHCLQQGYQRVFYFTEPEEGIPPRALRLQGYIRAMADRQLPQDIMRVRKESPVEVKEALRSTLEVAQKQPTAIYTANGLVMLEVLRARNALKQESLDVPIGLATFDDPDYATALSPPLSAVNVPMEDIGRIAMHMLLRRFEGTQAEEQHIVLRANVVPRESTRTII